MLWPTRALTPSPTTISATMAPMPTSSSLRLGQINPRYSAAPAPRIFANSASRATCTGVEVRTITVTAGPSPEKSGSRNTSTPYHQVSMTKATNCPAISARTARPKVAPRPQGCAAAIVCLSAITRAPSMSAPAISRIAKRRDQQRHMRVGRAIEGETDRDDVEERRIGQRDVVFAEIVADMERKFVGATLDGIALEQRHPTVRICGHIGEHGIAGTQDDA